MYKVKLFSTMSVVLLAVFTLNVEAQLKGQYPPLDQPPPPIASWTALVDQSKLPPAPVRVSDTACTAGVDTFCVWSCTGCLRPESDFDHCPQTNEWALTYDDGPTNFTLRVLDALNARGLKATFFIVGSRAVENPAILQQVVDSGHQIGVHTWSHSSLTTQTTEEIIAEVKWTELAIKEAVNLTPKWFRAPKGDCDDRVRGILTQLGYKIAFWDSDTFDWESSNDPNFDLNWIPGNFSIWTQNKTSGHASLEHDAFDRSSSMASQAMDIVINAKFNPESISVCLGNNQPYVENVQLARSNIVANTNITTTANPVASSTSPSHPTSTVINTVIATAANPITSEPSSTLDKPTTNSAGSIERILLLYIMCGLGFVGTYYI